MDGLTIRQVARLIGRHPGTIRRWERRGLIPVARRGRFSHWRVWTLNDVDAIQRLIAGDGRRKEPAP